MFSHIPFLFPPILFCFPCSISFHCTMAALAFESDCCRRCCCCYCGCCCCCCCGSFWLFLLHLASFLLEHGVLGMGCAFRRNPSTLPSLAPQVACLCASLFLLSPFSSLLCFGCIGSCHAPICCPSIYPCSWLLHLIGSAFSLSRLAPTTFPSLDWGIRRPRTLVSDLMGT